MIDDIVTTGILALFGGVLVWMAIGWLVARFKGFNVGLATGMILFGLTGLAFAARLAWVLWGPGTAGEPTTEQIGIVGVFGAFGGFGALGGGIVLASELEERNPRPPQPVAPWRARMATGCTVAGNLVLVGGMVMGMLLDDDMTHGAHTAFRGVTIACACWFAASVLGHGLRLYQTLFFLLLGGGFHLAAESLRLFG